VFPLIPRKYLEVEFVVGLPVVGFVGGLVELPVLLPGFVVGIVVVGFFVGLVELPVLLPGFVVGVVVVGMVELLLLQYLQQYLVLLTGFVVGIVVVDFFVGLVELPVLLPSTPALHI